MQETSLESTKDANQFFFDEESAEFRFAMYIMENEDDWRRRIDEWEASMKQAGGSS